MTEKQVNNIEAQKQGKSSAGRARATPNALLSPGSMTTLALLDRR
jgi:hypothetical protein